MMGTAGAGDRSTSRPIDRRALTAVAAVLLLLTLGVYAQVVHFDFLNYDDPGYVTNNPRVKAGLSISGFLWALTTYATGYWHPLTWLSHMLDCTLFGVSPGPHHMTNVLLHGVNTVVLLLVLARATGALWKSAFVAAIFALHPLHVESVAWIAERKDLVSTLFWLLAIGAYLGYARHPRTGRYLVALVLFALGLMAKPMIVTLPAVLLLLDVWPLRRGPFARWGSNPQDPPAVGRTDRAVQSPTLGRLLLEKVPFLALAVASSAITFAGQNVSGIVATTEHLPFAGRLAHAVVSYATYLVNMVWPARLAVIYPLGQAEPAWKVLAAGILLAAISVLALGQVQRRPYLAVGWLWYLGTLVPVIGIVQVGTQARADRYTYVPMIGILIMVAWAVPAILPLWRHRALAFASTGAAIALAAGIASYHQAGYWRSSTTLFRHAIEVTENNVVAHNNLAIALALQGRREEALALFEKALRMSPNEVESLNNLGVFLAKEGRMEEALARYTRAVMVNPRFADARANLGAALLQTGKVDEAIVQLREAVRLAPDAVAARINLATALLRTGQAADASRELSAALGLEPASVPALGAQARLLASYPDERVRNGAEAVRLAERARDLTARRDPAILEALAMAYAEAGRFGDAATSARAALDLALAGGQSALAARLREELSAYADKRPWREPLGL